MTFWIALMSKLFFVFCRSSLFLFLRSILNIHTKLFFFSFKFFFWSSISIFFEALKLIDMHNNDGFSELAREYGRGSTREACHAHFSWSSCCSKDETRGAFFFFFLNPRLFTSIFCLIWFVFFRNFFKKALIPGFIVQYCRGFCPKPNATEPIWK